MPGDNIEMEVELVKPDRHGRRPALRHSRRRPDRRLRRGDEDSGVTSSVIEKLIGDRFAHRDEPVAGFNVSGPGRKVAGLSADPDSHMEQVLWPRKQARIRLAAVHRVRHLNYRTEVSVAGGNPKLEIKKYCRGQRKRTVHKISRK